MLKKYLPVDIDATGVPVPGTGVVRVGSAGGGGGCLPTGGLDELAVGVYVEELAVGVYVDDGCLAVVVVELAVGSLATEPGGGSHRSR